MIPVIRAETPRCAYGSSTRGVPGSRSRCWAEEDAWWIGKTAEGTGTGAPAGAALCGGRPAAPPHHRAGGSDRSLRNLGRRSGRCGRRGRAPEPVPADRRARPRLAGDGWDGCGEAGRGARLGAATQRLGGRTPRRGSHCTAGQTGARGRGRPGLLLGQGGGARRGVGRAVGYGQSARPHHLRTGAALGERRGRGTRGREDRHRVGRAVPLRRCVSALGCAAGPALSRPALTAAGRPPARCPLQAAPRLRGPGARRLVALPHRLPLRDGTGTGGASGGHGALGPHGRVAVPCGARTFRRGRGQRGRRRPGCRAHGSGTVRPPQAGTARHFTEGPAANSRELSGSGVSTPSSRTRTGVRCRRRAGPCRPRLP